MIKLKNNAFWFLFILVSINCYSQKIKYDFDVNGEEDFVTFNKEGFEVTVNLNGTEKSFEIPEIAGYENISIKEFDSKTIAIHYSASISTIDLLLKYENKKWRLKNSVFYDPCQTCQDGEIKTCENEMNLEIDKITDENVESLVFAEKNCRKFKQNYKGMSVKELWLYTDKILVKEIILDAETIDKTLKLYPVKGDNIQTYRKIKKKLDAISFDTSHLDTEIKRFEERK